MEKLTVPRTEIIRRGLKGRCPNCGQSGLFAKHLRLHRNCPSCGMRIERGNGFYLCPLSLNYGIVVFGVITPLLLLGFRLNWELKTILTLGLAISFILPLLLYRLSWSCWLMLYYACLPHELNANRPEICDDLSFDEDPLIRR
ncbi:DUF983 domain-containing protein [Coraliomargarita akajimensis]|uniref:DUF983 domain-containing protein n=1 Tax=Coraliomargarita akajimensis (strain DSM 45221 / IAM 15411 / JCM 23193 / KCTC 12865 / 04OKA010-24) TaxID=583355 RepID=D5ENN9_CORAD|nr:DUF983 domain-containing protein [Coraliomargarita akajimensis]ADE55515.1 conserved hypothetical protein [Coraliomargarita akajimensis DSM 45221]